MTRQHLVLLTVALLAGGTVVAGDAGPSANTWVSADGGTFVVHGDHAFSDGDVEVTEFDLSELRDGEARTLPAGDGEIVATRAGDVVTITGPGIRPDRAGRDGSLTCDVSNSACELSIVTIGDGHRMVLLDAGGRCEGDECPHVVSISRSVVCTGDGADDTDCRTLDLETIGGERIVALDALGVGGDARVVIENVVGASPRFRVGRADRIELRCPEGDTVMSVERGRAEEVFLCPDHALPLERSATPRRAVFVTVEGDDDPSEH